MKIDLFSTVPSHPKIAFLGASTESAQVLEALLSADVEVAIVVTKEPKRRSRGSDLSLNPVEEVAKEAGVDVSYDLDAITKREFDLAVVVAFGQLIPSSFIAKWPFLNIHYSLLPRWRGAAPVERAILSGDETTGVALMEIVEALDAGRVFDVVEVSIDPNESSAELRARLTSIGIERLLRVVEVGGDFFANAKEQRGEVTYAKKIKSEEFRISGSVTVAQILRFERVSKPFGISSEFGRVALSDLSISDENIDDQSSIPIGVLRGDILRLVDGLVRVGTIQVEGKRAMAIEEFRRGNRHDISFVF